MLPWRLDIFTSHQVVKGMSTLHSGVAIGTLPHLTCGREQNSASRLESKLLQILRVLNAAIFEIFDNLSFSHPYQCHLQDASESLAKNLF